MNLFGSGRRKKSPKQIIKSLESKLARKKAKAAKKAQRAKDRARIASLRKQLSGS